MPGEVAAVLPAIAAVSEPLDGLRTALSLVAASAGHAPDDRPHADRSGGPTRWRCAR